jgi:hypothetical protein
VTRQLITAIGGVDATPVDRLLAPHLVVRASTQATPGVDPATSDRNARTPEPDLGS